MATDTASKSTKTLTEIVQIWYTLLHENPGVVVLGTSAKYLKVWKVSFHSHSFKIRNNSRRKYKNFSHYPFIKYNHSLEWLYLTPVEILSKQPGDSNNDMEKNPADFRPNSTG